MDAAKFQDLAEMLGGSVTALALLALAAAVLAAVGLRQLRRRCTRLRRCRRSRSRAQDYHRDQDRRTQSRRSGTPRPADGGGAPAAGVRWKRTAAAGAGGELAGLLTARQPCPAQSWAVYRRLQSGLLRGEYLPQELGPVYIHPCVQVGALLGGEAALRCDPQRFWRLHALHFEFLALGSSGRVICAFELGAARQGGRPPPEQLLKRDACRAAGLPLHDRCRVWPGSDAGYHAIGGFIASALQQGLVPHPEAVRVKDEQLRAFLLSLELRERLFGAHGEDRFFFDCLQPLARSHGLRVFCQTPLTALLELAPGHPELQRQLQQLSVDYTLCDGSGGVAALVELDGSSHQRADVRRRDALKDRACAAAGVPLVRMPRREGRDDYTDPQLQAQLERMLEAAGAGLQRSMPPAAGQEHDLSGPIVWR